MSGASGASRAATPVPCPTAPRASARSRFNRGGTLYVPWGYVGGVQCDPVEKKPFFHVLPGQPGVQLRHARLRPALRLLPELGHLAGPARPQRGRRRRATPTPKRWSRGAVDQGARVLVSTYNEPLITAEWAVEIFKHARRGGAAHGVCLQRQRHAAGARLPAAAHRLLQGRSQVVRRPALSPAGRTARARFSRRFAGCTPWALGGGRDAAGCRASTTARTSSRALTEFLAGVSPDIPWHVTAFHADYRMTDPANTTPEMLVARRAIGQRARAALRLCRQPARPRRRVPKTHGVPPAAGCLSPGMGISSGSTP